jgi:hypothetical protein
MCFLHFLGSGLFAKGTQRYVRSKGDVKVPRRAKREGQAVSTTAKGK